MRLATRVDLELDSFRRKLCHRLVAQRCTVSGQQREQLAPTGEALEHSRKRRLGLAPRDDLVSDEPDRVARAEAALLVVSGRGSDGARPNRGERAAKPLRISLEIELWLVLDQRGEAYLGPARLDNRKGLLGQLGCSL